LERGRSGLGVKTKSIYEPAEPGDGVRVLITRYYPRGVKKDRFDRWVKPLSPSRELLSSYKAGKKSWDQFRESFLAELRESPEGIEALRTLGAQSQLQDVTLLCYEKEGTPCHRQVVRDILTTPEVFSRFLEARVADNHLGEKTKKASRSPKAPGVTRTPSTRIRFYSRRKVGRKAPK